MSKTPETLVAQVEFEGEPFGRTLDPEIGDASKQKRKVRIIGGIKKGTGDVFFREADECPIVPSDLPHVPLSEANSLHDYVDVTGPQLSSVRKHGASQASVDMDEVFRKRGGDPSFRPRKKGGFRFKSSAHEIEEERKRKIRPKLTQSA